MVHPAEVREMSLLVKSAACSRIPRYANGGSAAPTESGSEKAFDLVMYPSSAVSNVEQYRCLHDENRRAEGDSSYGYRC